MAAIQSAETSGPKWRDSMILVTGVTGFVGAHVAQMLCAKGLTVRALVRPSSRPGAIEGLPIERVSGDLRDSASLDAALRGVRQVYHVAADYRLWSKNPNEIFNSNVGG